MPAYSAVNSHGDVVVGNLPDNIKIIPKTGKSKVVNLPEPNEGKVITQDIRGLAVDKNNNVYVVRRLKTSTDDWRSGKHRVGCTGRELQCKAGLAQIGIFGRN